MAKDTQQKWQMAKKDKQQKYKPQKDEWEK